MNILMAGAGAMSEAIVKGWISSGLEASITMTNRSDRERLSFLREAYGVRTVETEDVSEYDVVVLAMQPEGVLSYLEERRWDRQLVISVAAHIAPEQIEAITGGGAAAAMPNTPVSLRSGMTGLWYGRNITMEQRTLVNDLFLLLGETVETDERTMPAFMAAAGCSPAFFYQIVDAMVPVLDGFDELTARRIIAQAMKGASEILLRDERSVSELIDDVAAAGGPTDRGLQILKEKGLAAIMESALRESAK